MSSLAPPPASPRVRPPLPVSPATAGTGAAATALALGIAGLVLGFVLLPLLGAVAAITIGSLGLQALAAGEGDPQTRGRLVAAIACGTVALCLWIPVAAIAAALNA